MKFNNEFKKTNKDFWLLGCDVDDKDLYLHMKEKYFEQFEFLDYNNVGRILGVYPNEWLNKDATENIINETILKTLSGLLDKKDCEYISKNYWIDYVPSTVIDYDIQKFLFEDEVDNEG